MTPNKRAASHLHHVPALTHALFLALVAEGVPFGTMPFINDDRVTVFRVLFGFHKPAVEAAVLMFPEMKGDDPNVSRVEEAIFVVIVFATAWIQWSVICLAVIVGCRGFR